MNKGLLGKAFVIGGLSVLILLALAMVNGVIGDRQKFRDDAVQAIERSYAGPQTLVGPVLVRPYTQTTETEEVSSKGEKTRVNRKNELTSTYFPHELDVRGTLLPSQRRHGLYAVTVYEFQGQINGVIDVADPPTEGSVVWGEPYLALSVEDVRGIVGTPRVSVNGEDETMVQGAPLTVGWQPNLRIPLRRTRALHGRVAFSITLNLAGTERLGVAPVGDSNHLELRSTWASPLFAAQFLPRTREVGKEGFTAAWDVSSLASGTQVQMQANPAKPIDMMDVSLLTPIDPYKLSDRATKYGILFVLLTFGGFFLFEIMKELPIHPVQYLLVGLGLSVFFLLLISFSERLPFGLAYVLASAACIGLLTFYLSFVLRNLVRGLTFGAMLAAFYGAVYGLLISEDNALILGSLMLFAVLAGVMVVTRKVDWYRGGKDLVPAPPKPKFLGDLS